MLRHTALMAVFTHYEESEQIRTGQRPTRDCRGPGAFINPARSTAGSAGNDRARRARSDAYAGPHSGAHDGGDAVDHRHEHGA